MFAHVELELDDVAVLHDVVAAFLTELAFLLDLRHGAFGGNEIVIGDDIGLDEALFEVGVDHAGGLRGGVALVDLPCAHFLLACGEEGGQAERVVADACQLVEAGFLKAGVGEHFARVVLVEFGQVGFELRVEEDGRSRSHGGGELGLEILVLQFGIVHVEHVDERLGAHQVQVVDGVLVEAAFAGGLVDGLTGFEDLLGLLDGVHVGRLDLLAAQILLQLRQRVLDGLQVGEDELGVDGVDVVGRVDLAVDVDDVVVFEGAYDLADRVGLADVGEELVAQAFAFGGALDDACDVDEGDGCRHDLLGVHELGEHRQTVVRQRHDAGVRLDGGERIVFRQHVVTGQCVEHGGLADVRQSDDSDSKRHGSLA